jgi:hypothetical protein
LRNPLLAAARSRSRSLLRPFLIMSLPSGNSPETASGGLVRESEHGTLVTP